MLSKPAGRPVVRIVDDNDAVRESLSWLLESAGLRVESYADAQAFLHGWQPETPGCLVLDLCLPGMSGLELQRRLEGEGRHIPIIFLTGHGDIPSAVEAMRGGATEFLTKPYNEEQLLEWVQRAVAQDAEDRRQEAERAALRDRLGALTPREQDVLELVVEGRMNREIAEQLHISAKTVEMHRARVMEKTGAGSAVELVRLYLAARSGPGRAQR